MSKEIFVKISDSVFVKISVKISEAELVYTDVDCGKSLPTMFSA